MCIYIYYIIYIETHLSVKSFCTNHRVQAFFLFFLMIGIGINRLTVTHPSMINLWVGQILILRA